MLSTNETLSQSSETRLIGVRIDHEKNGIPYESIVPPKGFTKTIHNDSRLQRKITKVTGRFPMATKDKAIIELTEWARQYADPELKAMMNRQNEAR